MATSPNQIQLINDALKALDITPADEATVSIADLNGGLLQLAKLLNSSEPDPTKHFKFDPATGYTEAVGRDLLSRMLTFRNGAGYKELKDSYNGFMPAAVIAYGFADKYPDAPQAIKADPKKLITLADQAETLIQALDNSLANGLLTPSSIAPAGAPTAPTAAPAAKPTMDNAIASSIVEVALGDSKDATGNVISQGLVSILNEGLEKGSENILAQLFAKDLVDQRIPGLGDNPPNGRLELREQAAIQGIMMVLSHQHVLGVPGALGIKNGKSKPFLYTPDKGNFIKHALRNIDKDNPPMFLRGMDEKQQKQFYDMIEGGKLDLFIDALDHLSSNDQLAAYQIFQGQGLGYSPVTKDILKSEVERLNAANPDAVGLLDTLILSYTRTEGINNILNTEDNIDLKIEGTLSPAQRLEDFYKKARDHHEKNNQSSGESFEVFLIRTLRTMEAMPFGYDHQRKAFRDGLEAALRSAATETDPDKAAATFARGVHGAMDKVLENDEHVAYSHRHDVTPRLHPDVYDFPDITSGGKTFTKDDIINAYNDLHVARADEEEQKYGRTRLLINHEALCFADDDGNKYIAVIDKHSMTFNIQKLDLTYFHEQTKDLPAEEVHNYIKEHVDEFRKNDPAFALMFPGHNYPSLSSSYGNFYDYAQGKLNGGYRDFASQAAEYKAGATEVKTNAVEDIGPSTVLIARGTSKDSARLAAEFRREQEARWPEISGQESRALTDYAYRLQAGPQIVSSDMLSLLEKIDGQTNLPVGSAQHISTPVKGADIQEGSRGPFMAYYDRNSDLIMVRQVPDYLLDRSQRGAFIEATKIRPSESTQEFYKYIQGRFPEMAEMLRHNRSGEINDRPLLKGEMPTHNENHTFIQDLNRVAKSLENQLDNAQYGTRNIGGSFENAAEKPPEKKGLSRFFSWGKSRTEPAPVEESKPDYVAPDEECKLADNFDNQSQGPHPVPVEDKSIVCEDVPGTGTQKPDGIER